MRTCTYDGPPFTEARAHPWTDSVASAAFRYHDLRASPALVRTALEDFVPWAGYDAVETFYTLLEWLNGDASPFESNDCAFVAPHACASGKAGLECSGRVMVLFRELALNASAGDVEWLEQALHRELAGLEVALTDGLVGTTRIPVTLLALPAGEQRGEQLMLSFWAWGATEAEVMAHLARVMTALFAALRAVATDA